jgi:hypothetical protein
VRGESSLLVVRTQIRFYQETVSQKGPVDAQRAERFDRLDVISNALTMIELLSPGLAERGVDPARWIGEVQTLA